MEKGFGGVNPEKIFKIYMQNGVRQLVNSETNLQGFWEGIFISSQELLHIFPTFHFFNCQVRSWFCLSNCQLFQC